ncbi:spore coat protein [Rossellomorea sp. BNER]|uniref:spore coat protein n=1 Tax=Rossellomorea sp. BNER TaxID=2962031 RepID=UPI003AF200F4|nr:spore coat protein [Rossellomorea sp. BNER]
MNQSQFNGQQPQSQNPPQMNHGGHELFDLHEDLSGLIGVLDQYLMMKQFIKDPELSGILDRQYHFIADNYNIIVDCFTTGKDPMKPTDSYKMTQSNTVTYGLKPSQPKKPAASLQELNDDKVSGQMLGSIKSCASLLTMTALEVTNPVVRRVIADSVPNFIEMAYELFFYRNKHGYYQVPRLNPQDMQMMVSGFGKTTQSYPLQ